MMGKWIFIILFFLNIVVYAYQNFLKLPSADTQPKNVPPVIQEIQPQSLRLLPADWLPTDEDMALSQEEAQVAAPVDAVVKPDGEVVSKQMMDSGSKPGKLKRQSDFSVEETERRSLCFQTRVLSRAEHKKFQKQLRSAQMEHFGTAKTLAYDVKRPSDLESRHGGERFAVFIKPQPEKFSDIEIQLQQQNIDFFSYHDKWRISLGVFGVRENAEKMLNRARELGFDPHMEVRQGKNLGALRQTQTGYRWKFRISPARRQKLRRIMKPYGFKAC